VVSTSWGLCEPELPPATAAAENTLFQEAAAQGQSVFAASGDVGAEGCYPDSNSAAVSDPASQPYVTGVGGTTLTTLGPPPGESAWNNHLGIPGGASGGGISRGAMPSYQSGAPSSLNVINSSNPRTCGPGGISYCREVPDVSADADPYH